LHRQSIPETRQHLIDMGNKLRHDFGANALAEFAIQTIKLNNHYIIDSIRHPSEVQAFRQLQTHKFILISINTPTLNRYNYLKQRKRLDDKFLGNFEQFIEMEKQEKDNIKISGQHIDEVMNMSEKTIYNDGTLDKFLRDIHDFCISYIEPLI
jgi:dephospho-CoA kinase